MFFGDFGRLAILIFVAPVAALLSLGSGCLVGYGVFVVLTSLDEQRYLRAIFVGSGFVLLQGLAIFALVRSHPVSTSDELLLMTANVALVSLVLVVGAIVDEITTRRQRPAGRPSRQARRQRWVVVTWVAAAVFLSEGALVVISALTGAAQGFQGFGLLAVAGVLVVVSVAVAAFPV